MIRLFSRVALGACFLLSAACSKQESASAEDDAEWADIQALPNEAKIISTPDAPRGILVPEVGMPVPDSEFEALARKLQKIKAAERQSGEALLTGKTLVFDHAKRFVQLNENVKLVDDYGEMETGTLTGRFSVSNEIEHIEAENGVVIRSEDRTAEAAHAVYDFKAGLVQLDGQARLLEGRRRLSGERIQFWVRGGRKVVCEPNVLLEMASVSVADPLEEPCPESHTEIRADRLVYDEALNLAEMAGNVRLRDPRGAMNCEKIRLHLKEGSEIDWIEALYGVIIQSVDRKALAERVTYQVEEDKFTLEGEPKVKQGKNIMTGDRITFWQKTRRMVCEPNARALLHLDEETRAKFLKNLND